MYGPSVTYRLKRFTSATDPGFSDALAIYVRCIPPSLRTDTNEIAYWVENYSRTYEDKFLVYGLYANREVAGYAQLAYFQTERLLVADYLVTDPKYRKHNVFFEFSEHLRTALTRDVGEVDYTVVELGYVESGGRLTDHGKVLVRLLKISGFGVVKAEYHQPQLGMSNHESEMRAVLMISAGNLFKISTLKTETYLRIVHAIYYKHYLRWYSIYTDQQSDYEKKLNRLYAAIKASTSKEKSVQVNGHQTVEKGESTVSQGTSDFRFAVFSSLCIIVLLFLLLGVRELFRVPLMATVVVFLVLLVAFVAFLAVQSERAYKVMDRLMDFTESFRKQK